MEFDGYLGPCDLKKSVEWKRISSYITKSTIERVQPIGDVTVSSESGSLGAPRTTMEMALAKHLMNRKFSEASGMSVITYECSYTSIPESPVLSNKKKVILLG
ncbi:hypothetical protein MKX03_005672 [Papaver bracteatum]|nr:hypothetical protein MKX03_005672 [Papaver bracteatum]